MYRPEGWKNPNRNYSASLAGAFEAGADAMLEALKKQGFLGKYTEGVDEGPWIVTDDNKFIDIGDVVEGKNTRGYLVFIPEA